MSPRIALLYRKATSQKSFILNSFGTIGRYQTPVVKTASLGFEPRQRDPESLVLPLHHEANERESNLQTMLLSSLSLW